jgi:hypothetical protein
MKQRCRFDRDTSRPHRAHVAGTTHPPAIAVSAAPTMRSNGAGINALHRVFSVGNRVRCGGKSRVRPRVPVPATGASLSTTCAEHVIAFQNVARL